MFAYCNTGLRRQSGRIQSSNRKFENSRSLRGPGGPLNSPPGDWRYSSKRDRRIDSYSVLKAWAGSMEHALRAGIKAASVAAKTSVTTEPANTPASIPFTS